MTRRAKTIRMLEVAMEVLRQCHPSTVRQVYYQLVSRQVIENKPNAYDAVSRLLVDARRRREIPWGWVEDRVRKPREVSMWDGLRSFMEDVRLSYRRDVWQDQPRYVEVWLEKDALSAIFEDVLRPYGVTLNVGRGFDGWSSIHRAARRYRERAAHGCETHVLYFGDFDPSGEAMVTSLRERLASCGARPSLVKVGVILEDIARYDLPPDCAKTTDTRRAKFVAQYGDLSVELDALPNDVLRRRLETSVRALMDLNALTETSRRQAQDLEKLDSALSAVGDLEEE